MAIWNAYNQFRRLKEYQLVSRALMSRSSNCIGSYKNGDGRLEEYLEAAIADLDSITDY